MSGELSSRTIPESKRRLAEVLAEQIEDEIIAVGWPVGRMLGPESELCEKYGVSRAVFREAIRIVGHHGVAEMRRGPRGGLIVLEPRVDAAVRTVFLNLEFHQINPAQINEARLALDLASVRAAIDNLDAAGEQRIRDFMETERAMLVEGRRPGEPSSAYAANRFHILLAELSGNPAMVLFGQILSRVTDQHSRPAATIDELRVTADAVHGIHERIAEAVLDRDYEAAKRRLRRHLNSVVGFLHE